MTPRITGLPERAPKIEAYINSNWCWISDTHIAATYQKRCEVSDVVVGKKLKSMAISGGTLLPQVVSERLIAGGGTSGRSFTVFDTKALKKLGTIKGHKPMIGGLGVLRSDPPVLVTGGMKGSRPRDYTLRTWDPSTLQETGRLTLLGPIEALVCNSTHIYAHVGIAHDRSHQHRLAAFTPDLTETWTIALERRDNSLALTPDGRLLLHDHGHTTVRSTADGSRIHTIEHDAKGGHTFSPDGALLFMSSTSYNMGTTVFDMTTFAPVAFLEKVLYPRFSPDGSRVVASVVPGGAACWDAADFLALW